MLALSICENLMHRWYDAIHQAMLKNELNIDSIWETVEERIENGLTMHDHTNSFHTIHCSFAHQNDRNLKNFLWCHFQKTFEYSNQRNVTVFVDQQFKVSAKSENAIETVTAGVLFYLTYFFWSSFLLALSARLLAIAYVKDWQYRKRNGITITNHRISQNFGGLVLWLALKSCRYLKEEPQFSRPFIQMVPPHDVKLTLLFV